MIWLDALNRSLKAGDACVLVTITALEGSAPRAIGTRMLVATHEDTLVAEDSIGGGALEQSAIEHAGHILKRAESVAAISSRTFVLGRELEQCCGGRVTLQFDYHPACAFQIMVFGAGHVAQALANILQSIPCRVCFHDDRDQWLNRLPTTGSGAGSIQKKAIGHNPHYSVEQCPAASYYLVMTHSHELDYELVEAIIGRGDSHYCGLIASKSKAQRCRTRLARKQFSDREIAGLTSPIGQLVATGKEPMEVAVAVVAELMNRRAEVAALGRPVTAIHVV